MRVGVEKNPCAVLVINGKSDKKKQNNPDLRHDINMSN